MQNTTELTRQMLRGFKYCPKTGNIFRFDLKGHRKSLNGLLRSKRNGYISSSVGGKQFYAHRAAFVLMGIDPTGKCIDHINGDRSDNRWSNLRLVEKGENGRNRPEHRAGHKLGTTRHGKKWAAQIQKNGRKIHLGLYLSQREAHAAYVAEKKR